MRKDRLEKELKKLKKNTFTVSMTGDGVVTSIQKSGNKVKAITSKKSVTITGKSTTYFNEVLARMSIVDGKIKILGDIYTTGGVSCYGDSEGVQVGLISDVYDYAYLNALTENPFSDSDLNNAVNAYASYELLRRIRSLETSTIEETDPIFTASPAYGITLTSIGQWNQAFTALHTHANKSVLDGITSGLVSNWNAAYSAMHTHANKAVLDGITETLVSNWNTSYTNNHTHANKAVLDGITATMVSNWSTAYTNNHTHSNKSLIDQITQGNLDVLAKLSVVGTMLASSASFYSEGGVSCYGDSEGVDIGVITDVYSYAYLNAQSINPFVDTDLTNAVNAYASYQLLARIRTLESGVVVTETDPIFTASAASGITLTAIGQWNAAYGMAHSHDNKAVLDGITSGLVSNWNSAYTALHSHDNKTVLDGITSGLVSNWNAAYTALHSHDNKTVLDGITATLVSNWNIAYTNNHTHSNKSLIDQITQGNLDVLAKLSIDGLLLASSAGFYSEGGISCYGDGGGAEVGVVTNVYGSAGLANTFSDSILNDTFNAYTIKSIHTRLATVESNYISTLPTATNLVAGIMTLGSAGGAAAFGHTHYVIGNNLEIDGELYVHKNLGTVARFLGEDLGSPFTLMQIDQDRIYCNVQIQTVALNLIGGTSSQFLKADGSVDESAYITTIPDASTTVKGIMLLGATGGAATYAHTHSTYAALAGNSAVSFNCLDLTSYGQLNIVGTTYNLAYSELGIYSAFQGENIMSFDHATAALNVEWPLYAPIIYENGTSLAAKYAAKAGSSTQAFNCSTLTASGSISAASGISTGGSGGSSLTSSSLVIGGLTVSFGANDSAGTGYRLLRVPNA